MALLWLHDDLIVKHGNRREIGHLLRPDDFLSCHHTLHEHYPLRGRLVWLVLVMLLLAVVTLLLAHTAA
jgi:hypothetical protein